MRHGDVYKLAGFIIEFQERIKLLVAPSEKNRNTEAFISNIANTSVEMEIRKQVGQWHGRSLVN